MRFPRFVLLSGALAMVAYVPAAQAQALPGQLLLNAASWVFQKMMEDAGKPPDPYASSSHYDTRSYDTRSYDASAFAPSEQFAPRSPTYSHSGTDTGSAYQPAESPQ